MKSGYIQIIIVLFAIGLTGIFLFGCTTVPMPSAEPYETSAGKEGKKETSEKATNKKPDPGLEKEQKKEILTNAQDLIGRSTSKSLREAIRLLEDSPFSDSEEARESIFIAWNLLEILYIEQFDYSVDVLAPQNSKYPAIFQSVKRGEFPSFANGSISFLSKVIPCLSVLYTDSKTVLEQSRNQLEQARQLKGNSVIVPFLLGVIEKKLWNLQRAVELFHDVRASVDEHYLSLQYTLESYIYLRRMDTYNLFRKAYNSYSDRSKIQTLYAFFLFFSEETEKAIGIIREKNLKPETNPLILYLQGFFTAEKENWQELSGILKRIELETSSNPEYYVLKLRLLQGQSQLDKAYTLAETAVSSFPWHPELNYWFGLLSLQNEKEKQATEVLSPLLNKEYYADRVNKLLADYYEREKEYKKAKSYIEPLEKDGGNNFGDISDIKLLKTANKVYMELNEYEKALKAAQRLRDISDEYSVLYINTLLDSGKVQEANKEIDMQLNRNLQPKTESQLLVQKSKMKDSDSEKETLLLEALYLNSENLKALTELYKLYTKLEKFQEAYIYAKQAASLSSNSAQFESIEEDISNIRKRLFKE